MKLRYIVLLVIILGAVLWFFYPAISAMRPGQVTGGQTTPPVGGDPSSPPAATPPPNHPTSPVKSSHSFTDLCAQEGCPASDFSPLVESNGTTNPNGQKFQGYGKCYTFVLPSWVASFDYWDGSARHMGLPGNQTIQNVCEASIRGNTSG